MLLHKQWTNEQTIKLLLRHKEGKQSCLSKKDKNTIVRKIDYFQALMVSCSAHVVERNKEKRTRKLCYKRQFEKPHGSKGWKDLPAFENVGNSVAGRAIVPLNTVSVAMVFVTWTVRTAGLLWTLHSGPEGLAVACLQMYLCFIKHYELTTNEKF